MPPRLDTKAEILAARAEDLDCFSGLKLSHVRATVSELLSHFGREGIFHEYTKHDISHVDEMLRILNWLIPDTTWNQLTPTDALLHVLSIYFHDLGLFVTHHEYEHRDESGWRTWVDGAQAGDDGADYRARLRSLDPDDRERFLYQEYVRAHHGERIRTWINGTVPARLGIATNAMSEVSRVLAHLPVAFRDDLGRVCESHHRSDIGDVQRYSVTKAYGASSAEEANVQYATFLLRTVDLLDITASRTPSVAFRLIAPSDPTSQVEWAKQRAVTAVRPKPGQDADGNVDTAAPRDTIQVFAHFTADTGFFALIAYLAYARAELEQTYAWAREAMQRHGSTYEFPWRAIDDSEIRTSGFLRQSLEFSLDAGRVLDLLTGHTLYDNTAIIVRELVQNALDAVRTQQFEHPNMRPGEIDVNWNQRTRVLSVRDNGTGMTQATIERHLLRVGSSRYQDPEFMRTHPGFAPISRFGIGILSTFMIADSVTITTLTRDEREGRQLHLRSVHGKYLVRTFERDDDMAQELGDHGTKVTVCLRPSATLDDVKRALQLWVVVPGCSVKLTIDDDDPTSIGHPTVGAALRETIDVYKDAIRSDQVIDVVEEQVDGLHIAYARQWSPLFNEWQFLTRSERDTTPPLGLCVQGIRVDFDTPGFTTMPFFAMANATGRDAPRTDVTRTTLEQTEERRTLIRRVFGTYAKFVAGEVAALANRGYSLTWQAREARVLTRPIVVADAIEPGLARAALATIPSVVVDDGVVQRLCTAGEVAALPTYWTSRSLLFDAVESVLMELSSNASVVTLTTAAGGAPIEFPPGPRDAAASRPPLAAAALAPGHPGDDSLGKHRRPSAPTTTAMGGPRSARRMPAGAGRRMTQARLAVIASPALDKRSYGEGGRPICRSDRRRLAVPFRPSLRSFCGPACREQKGTGENGLPRSPGSVRVCRSRSPDLQVLNLRLFIGETGGGGLGCMDSAGRGRFRGRSERREPIGRFTPSVLVVSWGSVAKAASCECPLMGLPAGARGR
jgi:hypothetical protein